MKKFLCSLAAAAMLTFAAPAFGGAYTIPFTKNFPGQQGDTWDELSEPLGNMYVAAMGDTVRFGCAWVRAYDCDQYSGPSNTCIPCIGLGFYRPRPSPGGNLSVPMRGMDGDNSGKGGDFANEPGNDGAVAAFFSNLSGCGDFLVDKAITFPWPMDSVSFEYSTTGKGDTLNSFVTGTFPCYDDTSVMVGFPANNNSLVYLKSAQTGWSQSSLRIDSSGVRQVRGDHGGRCEGDPRGYWCKWYHFVARASDNGGRLITAIYPQQPLGNLGQWFLDNLTMYDASGQGGGEGEPGEEHHAIQRVTWNGPRAFLVDVTGRKIPGIQTEQEARLRLPAGAYWLYLPGKPGEANSVKRIVVVR